MNDTNVNSMEPPEADNARVARRAGRAKDPEPLDIDELPAVMPSEVDLHTQPAETEPERRPPPGSA
jgi:hypothetical protein